MASSTTDAGDDSLYPIAVLIDELRNDDVQVRSLVKVALFGGRLLFCCVLFNQPAICNLFSPFLASFEQYQKAFYNCFSVRRGENSHRADTLFDRYHL